MGLAESLLVTVTGRVLSAEPAQAGTVAKDVIVTHLQAAEGCLRSPAVQIRRCQYLTQCFLTE